MKRLYSESCFFAVFFLLINFSGFFTYLIFRSAAESNASLKVLAMAFSSVALFHLEHMYASDYLFHCI